MASRATSTARARPRSRGRIGERVATEQCTVVDDGTLSGRRGSLNVDDEGTPTQCNTLIEGGILKGYMHDKMNARLMKTRSTGNGRRESFAYAPMPRMTNTYMLPGKYDPEEIIASVDKGIYAPNFGGGQVDITIGQVRVLGERGVPDRERQEDGAREGRDADRQRSRGAHARVDGRQRSHSSTRGSARAARTVSPSRWAWASRRFASTRSPSAAPRLDGARPSIRGAPRCPEVKSKERRRRLVIAVTANRRLHA